MIELSVGPVEIVMRRNVRARRYSLRITPRTGQPAVTVPKGGNFKEAAAFVGRHRQWLETRLEARPEPQAVNHGMTIPLRGQPTRVIHDPTSRRAARLEIMDGEPAIVLSCRKDHLARRLRDFLLAQARADLKQAVAIHGTRLDVKPKEVRLRDTSSRWGSASSRGSLMFSWRLILAPPFVLDYVAAHEVAHLLEMNHSDRFWAHVAATYGDHAPARDWLKRHGTELMMILAPQ